MGAIVGHFRREVSCLVFHGRDFERDENTIGRGSYSNIENSLKLDGFSAEWEALFIPRCLYRMARSEFRTL